MERLTEKCWRNLDPWECCGQDKNCTKGCHDEGGCAKGCVVPKLYRRLAEYEDAEEQGLLVRLPIRLGNPCYVLEKCTCAGDSRCKPKAAVVRKFTGRYSTSCMKIHKRSFNTSHISKLGKSVFATLEEAMAAVERRAE